MPEKYTFNLHNGGKFQLSFEPSDTIEKVKEYFFENFGPSFDPKKLRLVTAGKIMQNTMSLSHYIDLSDPAAKPSEILVINANPPKDLLQTILQKYSIGTAKTEAQKKTTTFEQHDGKTVVNLVSNNLDIQDTPVNKQTDAKSLEEQKRSDYEIGKRALFETHKSNVDLMYKDFINSMPKIDMMLQSFNIGVLTAIFETLKSMDERVVGLMLRSPTSFIELYNKSIAEIKSAHLKNSKNPSATPDMEPFHRFLMSFMGMLQYDLPSDVPPVELDDDKFDQLLNQSNMSNEDKAAIIRISELGFSKLDSFQAYLACGRDEDLAANFLLNDSERK